MATLEEIEKRLKALEDVEEIKQMHIRYILALNHQNFEEMIDCFTEDAILEYVGVGRCEGKEEVAKFFRRMAKHMREIKMFKGGQIIVHPVISVDGDTAKGCWTWYRLIGPPQKFTSPIGLEIMQQTPVPGFYTMEYKRVDGKWKMWRFHLTHDWFGEQWPKAKSRRSWR